jgi:hypothetical protein
LDQQFSVVAEAEKMISHKVAVQMPAKLAKR